MKKILTTVSIVLVLAGAYFIYQSYARKAHAERAASEWAEIKEDTSAARFDNFISRFQQSEFAPLAQQKRDSLTLEKDWQKTKAANSIEAFLIFKGNHPVSPYAKVVDAKISTLRLVAAWQNALKKNTVPAYKAFISDYPASRQAAKAKKKIIDIEVENIFAGRHGELPPPQKISSGDSQSNRISIENQTDYTLTVRYSGHKSIKVILKAHGTDAVMLPSGQYKVAASVSHANVIPFAGSQNLSGGEYSSVYYISGL